MAIITCLPHKQSHSLSLTLLHVFSLRTLQAVQVDLIPSWFGPSSQDPNATSNLTLQQGTFNVSLFNAWIFGNIVEAVQTISMQRKADALKYVQTHPLVMFYLLVDMLLLSLGVVYTGYVNEVGNNLVAIIMACWTWVALCCGPKHVHSHLHASACESLLSAPVMYVCPGVHLSAPARFPEAHNGVGCLGPLDLGPDPVCADPIVQ